MTQSCWTCLLMARVNYGAVSPLCVGSGGILRRQLMPRPPQQEHGFAADRTVVCQAVRDGQEGAIARRVLRHFASRAVDAKEGVPWAAGVWQHADVDHGETS